MSKRAIVVGAGIAGIATSIRLAKQGFSVEVFEASQNAGGKMSAFETEGYRFDGGPSLFTLAHLVDELFILCDEDPKAHFNYQQLDTICHYFYEDGTRFQAHKSWDDFSASLEGIATVSERLALKNSSTKPLFATTPPRRYSSNRACTKSKTTSISRPSKDCFTHPN